MLMGWTIREGIQSRKFSIATAESFWYLRVSLNYRRQDLILTLQSTVYLSNHISGTISQVTLLVSLLLGRKNIVLFVKLQELYFIIFDNFSLINNGELKQIMIILYIINANLFFWTHHNF